MKPKYTLNSVLRRLEEAQERRHRERLAAAFPTPPSCPRHGWSVERGPGVIDATALASLCPACREERRAARRAEEAPEVVTLDVHLPPAMERAWKESLLARERAGHVVSGSSLEREALRTIDEERAIEMTALQETPTDRRRHNEAYWRRRMLGVHTQAPQQYEPHPARAGP